MNRRNFLGSSSLGILALFLPWAIPKRKKLKARWTAKLSPHEAEMMGYTRQQILEAGYVYAPYEPIIYTPLT